MSVGTITSALRTLFAGDTVGNWRAEDDQNYDVKLSLRPDARRTPGDLLDLGLATSVAADGTPRIVRLAQVADVSPGFGPNQITRRDLNREVEITANATGRSLGEVSADIQQILDRTAFPPGYGYRFGGSTRDMQESVMSIRMMPISFVFSRFPRVVRDLASKLDKQVELVTIGEATELDKGLIEKIADPLTHLVRNSLDHGIESPDRRIAAGKPAKGTITLSASHQGGSIAIEVSDDGAGLNRDRILAKAMERGLNASESMPDNEVWMLIFEPGFSTAEVVTDVSGRGVGMDVVKRNITEMGGTVTISSAPGVGSTITIRLPLTLAILDGMSVSLGDSIYVVPLNMIVETLQPKPEDIRTVSGQGHMVQVRGEYLPIIALHKVFNMPTAITDPCDGVLVLIEAGGRKAALFMDALVGQQQVVIKSLETNFRKIVGVSGATIMGDGTVALILDVATLIKMGQ
ncbi:chemotaxis protein CheA [mine drainage metagenome]|uniref:histidine kinase n=1 Tax=mine drainage metagenome TaxID=410659 RepID=A0A1J5Q328_9ZZZZ